jgi:hypothetical protein
MHDDRSAPQRARATCSYLVVGYARVPSRRTDWLCAKIWLVTVDILVEGHVKERRIVPILRRSSLRLDSFTGQLCSIPMENEGTEHTSSLCIGSSFREVNDSFLTSLNDLLMEISQDISLRRIQWQDHFFKNVAQSPYIYFTLLCAFPHLYRLH